MKSNPITHDFQTTATDLLAAFDEMDAAVKAFVASVEADKALPCYVPVALPKDDEEPKEGEKSKDDKEPKENPNATQKEMRELAADLYGRLFYTDDQEHRQTASSHGLVGSSQRTVDAAIAANKAKDAFRLACKGYRGHDLMVALNERDPTLKDTLNRQGLGRIHLKQCYRHIPVLHECPRSIGFSWYSRGRSIQKITKNTAEELLKRMGAAKDHIEIQLKILAGMTEKDCERLRRVQNQVPVARANIRFNLPLKPDSPHKEREAMNCPLPIIFPLAQGQQLPMYPPIGVAPPAQTRDRLTRSDKRIEDEPLLPSINVYMLKEIPHDS